MAETAGWDPAQYRQFAEQRSQPLEDLIDLLNPTNVRRAVDLGCGPGEMTRRLAERVAIDELVGVDNSASMLSSALPLSTPSISFEHGDISTWSSRGDVDLVFANASLQWVPRHEDVLARWTRALRPGGQLAVQVPTNATAPHHLIATSLADREPYRSAYGPEGPPIDVVKANVLTPSRYAAILYDLGYREQRVTLRVYPHVLPSARDVAEWAKGTTLTRFSSTMAPALFASYFEEYQRELVEALGPREPLFFPFARILMWGRLDD